MGGAKEYQFDTIKLKVEQIIDKVVADKCKNIAQYEPSKGQQQSNEIAEEIVRGAQELAGKNFKI